MSISPITLQMNVTMTNDMAQVQNNENMRAATEHMQFAQATEKQTKANSEMVIPKDTSKFPEYQYDAKEKGNNEYFDSRKKKGQKKKEEKQSAKDEKKKQVVQIDIKL